MAEKSLDQQVTEKREELAELERKAAGQTFQEYPKWITDPTDPSKGYTVASKEQEDAVRSGLTGSGAAGGAVAGNTFDLTPEEQEAQRLAKAEADKDAAKGKSRLAPESEKQESEKPSKKKGD